MSASPSEPPEPPEPRPPVAVDLRDYVTFDQAGATGRRVYATDVLAVDVVCLEPHQLIEARTFATADAIYTVLGGTAWLVADDAWVTLTALQSVWIPAATPHGVRNDAPDPLILQVLISPPDEAPEAVLGPAVSEPTDPDLGAEPPGALTRLRRALGG